MELKKYQVELLKGIKVYLSALAKEQVGGNTPRWMLGKAFVFPVAVMRSGETVWARTCQASA